MFFKIAFFRQNVKFIFVKLCVNDKYHVKASKRFGFLI